MTRAFVTRFAPTPNGPLHRGSLVAALASYLFIKSRPGGGRWRLRFDDVDGPRVKKGAADEIQRQLERLHLHWDGEVVFQSRQMEAYEPALSQLQLSNRVFACSCSRKRLDDAGVGRNRWGERVYPGYCEGRPDALVVSEGPTTSLRYRLRGPEDKGDPISVFFDLCLGPQRSPLVEEWGFPILRRADGVMAYHLANVVDDESMGVTHVIRGGDLLGASHVHLALSRALSYSEPQYGHVGLVLALDGQKIGKSTGARPVGQEENLVDQELREALLHLGFENIPTEIRGAKELLDWGLDVCRQKPETVTEVSGSLWFSKDSVESDSG